MNLTPSTHAASIFSQLAANRAGRLSTGTPLSADPQTREAQQAQDADDAQDAAYAR